MGLIGADIYSRILDEAIKDSEELDFTAIGQGLNVYWVVLWRNLLIPLFVNSEEEHYVLCLSLESMILNQNFRTFKTSEVIGVQESKSSVYDKLNSEILNL